MRILPIVLLGFLLAVSVAAGAFALLPACGVTAPFLGRMGVCETPERIAAAARLEGLDAANAGLSQQIASLERELGAQQCTQEIAEAPALAYPVLPAFPEPEGIDTQAWNTGDLSLLEGCWSLDSSFATTNLQTSVVSRYDTWRMCFGADGSGTEEMRADTGTTCSGPVSAAFEGSAPTLLIEEPANLQCSDGGFIYRLVSRCALGADGTASCQIQQPDAGRSGSASFRRAARNN